MKGFRTIVVIAVLVAVAVFFWMRRGDGEAEIEYRYQPIELGEIVSSTSATGLLVPLTTVDVKSKAGGTVVKLAVDEGSVVKMGDLVAMIDPADTQASFDQASADLTAAEARAAQADRNYELQVANSRNALLDAQEAVVAAEARLAKAKIEAERQPTLASSSLRSAQAAYDAALADEKRLNEVTIPQLRRDTAASLNTAKYNLDTARTQYERAEGLLTKGYISQAERDTRLSSFESAKGTYATAQQRADTLEKEIAVQLEAQKMAVRRARATLDQAEAGLSDVQVAQRNLVEAKSNLEVAKLALQRSKDAQLNNVIRKSEAQAARANTVRSKVSVANAKVQLDSTTVLAPRDGVVTIKYLEEGTIIPPGTSTFAQGTSLVQISDTTRMFVDCSVDETDVSMVKVGQPVRIVTEAFPGDVLKGVVRRVNPAAVTEQNVTAIKVRVEVLDVRKVALRPGMNATCEFITLSKPNVLVVPPQAVQWDDEGKPTVKVRTADPKKPEIRVVELGAEGNDGFELLSGLKEGEEVVVAEIDLAQLRETQEKMAAAEEGGGLAGGGPRPNQRNRQRAQPTGGAGRGMATGSGPGLGRSK